jgi:outer membrane protein OmpA-like peptidoglycan-associated protein
MNQARIYRLIFVITCVVTGIQSSNADTALTGLEGNWSDAKLNVALIGVNSDEIVIGNKFQFEVSSSATGYVTLAHVNADDEVSIIFPGALTQSSNPNISAGENLIFPGAADNLDLEAQLPLGKETIYAIQTEEPITSSSFGDAEGALFIEENRSVKLDDQLAALITAKSQSGKVAVSELSYEIVPLQGDVQFTTRAIERYFEPTSSKQSKPKSIPLRIQFEFDSAVLTDNAKRELDVFGEALSGDTLSGQLFTITGHTDSAGDEDYNMHLSRQRANSTIAYLVSEHDIVETTLAAAAFGETQPRADNSSDKGRRDNRRVEFIKR